MKDEEISDEVARLLPDSSQDPWIILTGGEPSLQIDRDFIDNLKKSTGCRIAIETNGSMPLPDNIDWVTVSPKEKEVVVEHADEIKVVDCGQELEKYFSLRCRGVETMMYLQPCFVADRRDRDSNLRRTVRRVLEDPRWRLSLQTHRLIGIR